MLMQFLGLVLISFLVVSVILNERKMFAYSNVSPVTDLFNPLHLIHYCCEQEGAESHPPWLLLLFDSSWHGWLSQRSSSPTVYAVVVSTVAYLRQSSIVRLLAETVTVGELALAGHWSF